MACSINAVKDNGATLALLNGLGKKMFLAGTRPEGGLLNLMNSAGNPVFIAGFAEGSRGGAVSVKNGRGLQVFTAGAGEADGGTVTVWDADGRKPRSLTPAH